MPSVFSERTTVFQRVSAGEAELRVYSPRSWALLAAGGMIVFVAVACEAARRQYAPAWFLIPVFLLAAFVVWASTDLYRRSPNGILHFEIGRSGVRFGGLAFRREASAPYSALKRVFVGDWYAGLVAPVLFEFHAPAFAEFGLVPYGESGPEVPVIVRSYRGVPRAQIEAELAQRLPSGLPIIRFESAEQFTQLQPLVNEDQ